MTSTTKKNGRYGNQFIRNIAVSLLAEKLDLKVNYSSEKETSNLGIKLFSGEKIFEKTIILDEKNYFDNHFEVNFDPNKAYFQNKEIINKIFEFLHRETIMNSVIMHNPFKERYKNNNDAYIHIRLGDVASKNPGSEYYLKALNNIDFENLYISTDSKNHKIVTTIKRKYRNNKNVNIIERGKIQTIQFASTCKHIILSHGSYSAIIGYLAYFSDVSYPYYDKENSWCGEIFNIPNWKEIK